MSRKIKKLLAEAKDDLRDLQKESDVEVAHLKADQILCELLEGLGFQEIVDLYVEIGKWYA